MKEISFIVGKALEGGFIARAVGESIFTEAETMEELQINVQEAIECHFEEDKIPDSIRLYVF